MRSTSCGSSVIACVAAVLAFVPACGGSSPTAPSLLLAIPPPDLTPPALDLPPGRYRLSLSGPSFVFEPFAISCTPPGIPSSAGQRTVEAEVVVERNDDGWIGRPPGGDTLELTVSDAGVVTTTQLAMRAVRGTLRGRVTDATSGWMLTFEDGTAPVALQGTASGGRFGQPTRIHATANGAARFVDRQGDVYDCTAVSIDFSPRPG